MTRYRFRPQAESLDRRDAPAVFGVPWPTANLTLSFAPDGTDVNGSPSTLTATIGTAGRAEVLRAVQTWAAAAGVNVGVVADGGQPFGAAGGPVHDARFGDIRVATVPLDGVVALALPFDRSAGTRSGDIVFNSRLPFGVGAGAFYDVFTTALHEAGHAFGLPGSADPASVMADEPATPRTGLAPADAAGIAALYGPRAADAYEGPGGNETPATALDIQPAGGNGPSTDAIRVTADVTTGSDVDVFRFRPNNLRGGGLTAAVAVAGTSLLVPRLEILDAAGTVIAAGDGGQPGAGDVTLQLPTATNGATYYARVTAAGAAFSVGGYTLNLVPDVSNSGGGSGDPIDPEPGGNDTPATATTLQRLFADTGPRLDYALDAGLSSPTDADVYRLRSPRENGVSAGVLTAFAWAKTAGLDPVIDITDHHGTPVPGVVLAHDGGAFTLQIPDAAANDDYFVTVRHAHPGAGATPGNYALAVDFGGTVTPLPDLAAGTLIAATPTEFRDLTVAPAQVLHLTLAAAGPAGSVRLSILDAAGNLVDSRLAAAGDTVSLTPYLPAGTYTLRAEAELPAGTVSYIIRGAGVSDPIGPRAVDLVQTPIGSPPVVPPAVPPTSPPAVPPTVVVSPPRPAIPVPPVDPISPNPLTPPPTDVPAPPGTSLRPAAKPLPRTVSAGAGSGGTVRSFAADGSERFSVAPFPGFAGGVRVAEADFNGDGVADLVAGTGPGGATHVRVLDGTDRHELFALDPFETAFTGGVYVAAGDVTGDGVPDLVITPDEGGGPRVDIYTGAGFAKVASFFGIDDPSFRGGARAAVGDLTGDGVGDLIVAAGFGGGPRVAGFDGTSLTGTPRRAFADFYAFEQGLRNGVFVAAGDIDGDGFADLIAGSGPGGGPRVTAFGGAGLLANRLDPRADFFAGDPAGRAGVPVAVKDFDADGRADIVAGSATGRVTAYRGADITPAGPPPELMAIDAFPGAVGVYVG